MKIGLMGFEFSSPNKGCEALVYSFLDIIKGALTTNDVVYNFSGTELGYVPEYFDEIHFINIYPRLKDFKFKYIRCLKECDIIFDVTMGDSFSDIYSKEYYNYLIIHKQISQFLCKRYILLPQTYGPFKEMGSAEKAIKIFRNSAKIYCRDEISQRLLVDKFNITDSELASDMAFVLPYDKGMYVFSDREKIGVNVSGLLYKGGFNKENQFNLSINYKKLVDRILSTLSRKYEVHLIPHVIDLKEDAHDDDYKICKILQEKYPETILAPAFHTPIEAKSYISNMKIFIGSRMHSTIAAFSSDVVTIPISYSRKFEGLFNSLNYEYVINGREETTESAYLKILQYIEDFDKLRNIQEKSLEIIKEKNNKFSNSIRNVLTNSGGYGMGYKNIENINIVVKLLKENKIRDLVISPGGTNIPLIKAVQDDSFFNCYSVVDERSASYFAIGIYLQKKVPVALICTSAQATRNYIPGLTEAFYKRVPILAITMEKHPRFKYQEYMQAPDQTSLPNDCVKKSFEMPFISDINDMYYSIRVANQAFLELSRDGYGPVQLCIPWLDFPLNDIPPSIRCVQRYECKEIKKECLSNKKILVLIGEHLPFTENEKDAINRFCEATDSVVYTNHLSNFNNKFSVNANLLLSTSTIDELNVIKPDIIISLGGQSGDYPFYLAFSKNILIGLEHWRVCQDGEVVDTYDKLTRVYQGDLIGFFANVNSESKDHSFYESWKRMANSKSTDLQVPFSNVSIAQFLHRQMPKDSIIQFSILNSLRVWNLFELDHTIECYSNVGAFGIDGGMSTLIGQSIATDKLAFMIIGDLAFFYDMNCLGIRHIKNNVRILLINNNGGIEFKLHGEDKQEQDKFIAAANYHGTAKGWSESCGFVYLSAYTMDEFKEKALDFIQVSDKPILLEAFVSDVDESKAYLSIMDINRNKTVAETIKSGFRESVKGILGEETFEKIKRTIKG